MTTVAHETSEMSVIPEREAPMAKSTSEKVATDVELGDQTQTEVKVRLSFIQRAKIYGAVEAYLFLSVFSMAVKNLVDVKLMFVKACVVDVGLSFDECRALDEHSQAFKDTDKIASWYIMVNSWVSTAISVVMGILIGSFCDKYQKKIPLIMVAVGIAIESSMAMFSAVFIDSPLYILVASKAPANLFGGLIIIISGIFAYMTQVTTPKSRQIRFAVLRLLILCGVTAGSVAAGYLFQEKHYTLVYSVSIGANVLGITLLALFMDDKNAKTKSMSYGEIAKAFFNIDCLRESYRLVVAPREGYKRMQIWLLLLASFVTDIPLSGTRALVLLYVKKRYSWDTDTLAYITGALRLGMAITTVIAVRLFTKKLKLRDPIIALIGLTSLAAHYLVRGLASTGLMYAMGYVVGALSGCSSSASDNLLTRLLNEGEIGKVFVFKSLIDSTTSAFGTSFFRMVIREFESTIPGAMFISSAMWILIPITIMSWILCFGTTPVPKRASKIPEDANAVQMRIKEATDDRDDHEHGDSDYEDDDDEEIQIVRDLERNSFICRL